MYIDGSIPDAIVIHENNSNINKPIEIPYQNKKKKIHTKWTRSSAADFFSSAFNRKKC